MIRINLLPRRRPRRSFLAESGVVAVAAGVITLLVWGYAYESWRNREVVTKTAEMNRKLVVVRRQVADVLALEAKIDDLKAREGLLRSLEAREVPWPEMLVDLAHRTPRDAWLASAAVNPAQSGGLSLSLSGSALSYNSIARFMTTLSQSQFYSDVDLQTAQRSGTELSPVVQFGMNLSMRPLPLPAAAASPASSKPVAPEKPR
jgi:Tfp pilus assembly protein PilN